MTSKQAIGAVLAGYGFFRMYKSSRAGTDVATISSGQNITEANGPLEFCANRDTGNTTTPYTGAMVITAVKQQDDFKGGLFGMTKVGEIWQIIFIGTSDADYTFKLLIWNYKNGWYDTAGQIDIPVGMDAITAAYNFRQAQIALPWGIITQGSVSGNVVTWNWSNEWYSSDTQHPILVNIIKK